MVVKFDPRAKLPKALQQRLDQWDEDPPKRQYKAYGPLNAYLQGHKFPSSHYLVKPQKLLRKRTEHDDDDEDPDYVPSIGGDEADKEDNPNRETEEGPEDEQENGNDDEEEDNQEIEEGPQEQENDSDKEEDNQETDEGPKEQENDGVEEQDENEGGLCNDEGDDDISVDSIDSNGNAVSNRHPAYPDFTVERFWGADVNASVEDVIGIIIEVASLTQLRHAENKAKSAESKEKAKRDFQNSVIRQLTRYMQRSVKDDRILGIAVLGREVALLEISSLQVGVQKLSESDWISMFDAEFVDALNQSKVEMDRW